MSFRRCMVGKGAATVESILAAECAPLPTLQARTSSSPRHDQILPFIDARDLAWADDRRAIELVEDRRSAHGESDVEAFALVDWALDCLSVEAGVSLFPQRILERRASALEAWHRDWRHLSHAAHPIRHDLDRLLRRVVAEHQLVLGIEGAAQRVE